MRARLGVREASARAKYQYVRACARACARRVVHHRRACAQRIEEGARKYYYYSLTERGKNFLDLLKSGNMIELMLAVSGKRLRN